MKGPLVIPSIYIYNYHVLNIVACLLLIGLRLILDDNYFETVPLIDTVIKYSLIGMIALNIGLLTKSIVLKTYTSVNETKKDIYQIMSFMVTVTFKVCIIMLTGLMWLVHFDTDHMNLIVNFFIGCFFIMYYVSFILFLYFGLLGARHRFKQEKVQHHWVFAYLSENQIRSVRTYQEEGKVIGIHFKGFFMNEDKNLLVIRNKTVLLSAFTLYVKDKNCKVDDLTAEDIGIIEMLSI